MPVIQSENYTWITKGDKRRFYPSEKAIKIALELNVGNFYDEEPFRFVVRKCESIDLKGLSWIEVYDHQDEFVAFWDA